METRHFGIGVAILFALFPDIVRAQPQVAFASPVADSERIEALQVELAIQGYSLRRVPLPTGETLSDRTLDAQDQRLRLGAAAFLWVELPAGDLQPPIVYAVVVEHRQRREARASEALDVIDPRTFAILAVSLLDSPLPIASESDPPSRASDLATTSRGESEPDGDDANESHGIQHQPPAELRPRQATSRLRREYWFLRVGGGGEARIGAGTPRRAFGGTIGFGVYFKPRVRFDIDVSAFGRIDGAPTATVSGGFTWVLPHRYGWLDLGMQLGLLFVESGTIDQPLSDVRVIYAAAIPSVGVRFRLSDRVSLGPEVSAILYGHRGFFAAQLRGEAAFEFLF